MRYSTHSPLDLALFSKFVMASELIAEPDRAEFELLSVGRASASPPWPTHQIKPRASPTFMASSPASATNGNVIHRLNQLWALKWCLLLLPQYFGELDLDQRVEVCGHF